MTINTLKSLINDKESICDQAFQQLKIESKNKSFNEEKCKRDLRLVFDAVTLDLQEETTKHITKAGFTYLYFHNGYIFNKQKEDVVLAIDILRKILISRINVDRLKILVNLKFDLLGAILNDATVQAVKWWDYAARILPLVALSIIFWTWVLDYKELFEFAIITTATIFFTAGVIWWWWALRKIGIIFITLRRAQEKFAEVRIELDNFKKNFIRK